MQKRKNELSDKESEDRREITSRRAERARVLVDAKQHDFFQERREGESSTSIIEESLSGIA